METTVFKNFRKALESLTLEDDEYILVRHILKAGERVEPHYHPKATEWMIINKGILDYVVVNEEYKNFNSAKRLVADEEMVFLFPRGKLHSIKAFTDVEYFVLRDKKDKTVYVKGGKA